MRNRAGYALRAVLDEDPVRLVRELNGLTGAELDALAAAAFTLCTEAKRAAAPRRVRL